MTKNKYSITDFEKIVYDYQTMVFRTAMGFVHLKEDAEDLTQEVFLNAYSAWKTFRGDAEISTWLYRITVNICLTHVQRKSRKGIFQMTETALKYIFNKESEEKNPQQKLETNDKNKLIKEAIDSLPEKQRVAFILSKYDDLPQKRIANIMQVTEGAVEQLLQRAKNNLQKKLEQSIGKDYH